jgi:Transglutaminase-like superfamily
VAEIVVRRPPPLPPHAGRGVDAVLRRVPSTCLERALVLQRWLAEHGTQKDVVIGVTGASDFGAHAWLDGERVDARFRELTRLAPPRD